MLQRDLLALFGTVSRVFVSFPRLAIHPQFQVPQETQSVEVPPRTPTDGDEPKTPEPTPYHTAPTTQVQKSHSPRRPTIKTSVTSPTPGLKIRDPSDDDESPVRSPTEIDATTGLYRQKIESMKNELGPNWLAALSEDRFAEQRPRNRSYSNASRTSTVRPERQSPGVNVGGRALV